MRLILSFVITLIIFITPIISYAADFEIEILNTDNGKIVSSYPYGAHTELIVASKSEDVRKSLPIILKVRVGDKLFTNNIPNDPQKVCRGADGCSIPGPLVKEESKGQPLEILATGSNGKKLAYFEENIPAGGKSLLNESKPSLSPKAPTLPSSSPTQIPSLTPSQAPTSPTPVISPKPEVLVSPDTSKKMGAGALIAAGLVLLWWRMTEKKPKEEKDDCKDECKEGECNFSVAKIETAVYGTNPDDKEEALKGLDLIGLLKYAPAKGGLSFLGKKLIDEAIDGVKKLIEGVEKLAKTFKGLDLYVIVVWKECKYESCKGKVVGVWQEPVSKRILIPPPKWGESSYNPKAWDEKVVLNLQKSHVKDFEEHVGQVIYSHLPDSCKFQLHFGKK